VALSRVERRATLILGVQPLRGCVDGHFHLHLIPRYDDDSVQPGWGARRAAVAPRPR